jgi:protein gp37
VSDRSDIESTEATWNPVTGCSKVSPGCAHCYAETFAERWRGVPDHPYQQGFDLRFWPERLEHPLRWRRPRMIFVNSMSNLFHEVTEFEGARRVVRAANGTRSERRGQPRGWMGPGRDPVGSRFASCDRERIPSFA